MDNALSQINMAQIPHSYTMRAVRHAEEWMEYFNATPKPHLTQTYAYGEAKQQTTPMQVERVVFEQEKTPVAICQVLQGRFARVPLVARINRGPVFLEESPSESAREGVMRLIRQRWRVGRGGALFLAPSLDNSDATDEMMKRLGFRPVAKWKGWCSALMDLSCSEEEIRSRMASAWRNRLKASLKSGLEVRIAHDEATMEWMLERHLENQHQKNFKGPKPQLLRALHRASPRDFPIVQAMHEGKPVGAMALLHFGCVTEYYIGWFGEDGRKHNVGNFLYWQSMCQARQAGSRWFDLGGYDSSDKYGRFKQNLHGAEYRLTHEWLSI